MISIYTGKPFITISPASVWFTKQYPPLKWAAFIDKLPKQTSVYLLGGIGDRSLCEAVIQMTNSGSTFNLAGELTFLQSAAIMKHARMNYVNDSAPMHFASAMNAPVTAVYCSTIPAFGYGPLSDISYIVEKQGPLYCRPCGLHGYDLARKNISDAPSISVKISCCCTCQSKSKHKANIVVKKQVYEMQTRITRF